MFRKTSKLNLTKEIALACERFSELRDQGTQIVAELKASDKFAPEMITKIQALLEEKTLKVQGALDQAIEHPTYENRCIARLLYNELKLFSEHLAVEEFVTKKEAEKDNLAKKQTPKMDDKPEKDIKIPNVTPRPPTLNRDLDDPSFGVVRRYSVHKNR